MPAIAFMMTPYVANFNIVPVALLSVIHTVLLKLNCALIMLIVEHPIDVLLFKDSCSVDEQSFEISL